MTTIRLALLTLLFLSLKLHAAQVAIIIDDVGYRQTDKQVLALPSEVTLSFLPFTPLSRSLSEQAFLKGHEIMLHLPMQALNGKAMGLGGITGDMSKTQIDNVLEKALIDVPYATGLNNHMGSYVTQLDLPMQWLMEGLKQRGLFFVDSLTTRYTKARKQADKMQVPNLKRTVFLDNDLSNKGLEHQFQEIINLSKTHDHFIVIAHPHEETIHYLEKNWSRLAENNIYVKPITQLLIDRYKEVDTQMATRRSALLEK